MEERHEVEQYVEALRALLPELEDLLGPEEGAGLPNFSPAPELGFRPVLAIRYASMTPVESLGPEVRGHPEEDPFLDGNIVLFF